MRRSRVVTAIVLIALAGTAGACGGSSGGTESSAGQSAPAAAGTLAVDETEFRIAPANPTVAKPGTVRITIRNTGKFSHALEVEGPSGEVKSDTVEPGESEAFSVDFAKAGTYEWYCPIDGHRQKGMQGKVTVR